MRRTIAASDGAMPAVARYFGTGRGLRRREARAFTRKFFEGLGYKVEPSETNFVMANIRRDSSDSIPKRRRFSASMTRSPR